MCINDMSYGNSEADGARSEELMVKMIREDLGIEISAQAWRMFLRHRWDRFAPLGHRIHDGKR